MKTNLSYSTLIIVIAAIFCMAISTNAQRPKPTETPLAVPTGSGGSVPTPKDSTTTTRPQSKGVQVDVEGPGALYIFRTVAGIDFVVKGDKTTILLARGKIVKPREGKRIPNSYIVRLAKGVTGIKYSSDLTPEDVAEFEFVGEVKTDCPTCTVFMPLNLKLPLEKRNGNYFNDPVAYETLGNQIEDAAIKRAFEIAGKRINIIRVNKNGSSQ